MEAIVPPVQLSAVDMESPAASRRAPSRSPRPENRRLSDAPVSYSFIQAKNLVAKITLSRLSQKTGPNKTSRLPHFIIFHVQTVTKQDFLPEKYVIIGRTSFISVFFVHLPQ